MIEGFTYSGLPARVVFGQGTLAQARDESAALGISRALVLSTPQQTGPAEDLLESLGNIGAGIFSEAAMHTPVEVTQQAMALVEAKGIDGTVALGGGSTTGLGKAIALRTGLPQVVIPTTYAGSEMTPILGQTEGGRKATLRDMAVLPETVIYDVDLTLTLPVALSVTSGMNAIAHAIESIYAQDRNPIVSLMALEAIGAFAAALPVIVEQPENIDARAQALYGAWLCGASLGSVGMALHHKLCHTLGGAFDLPHAETHTVVLPHATAFNESAVPDLLAPVAEIFGADSAGRGLQDFAERIGAPLSLESLGMPEDGIDTAADQATENPYWNPRAFGRDEIRQLLDNAWRGREITGNDAGGSAAAAQ